MKTTAQRLLEQSLEELVNARIHLEFSFHKVARLLPTLTGLSEEQLESVEAFTSRFGRAVDLLVNKVLRSLDRAELKPGGTLLDVVNRAEKRGFLADGGNLREMKDVRNMIAHDYAGAKLPEIFTYCLEKKTAFDAICDQVIAYARQVIKS